MADIPASPSPAAIQISPSIPPKEMQEGKVSAHAGVHILLPTYQLRPREDEKFSPAVAQRLAEQVLVDELKGKAYDDESVTNWAIVVADAVKKGVKGGLDRRGGRRGSRIRWADRKLNVCLISS